MLSSLNFREGAPKELALEFIELNNAWPMWYSPEKLIPEKLKEDRVLAIHYANAGAQGEPGLVEILYLSPSGIKILSGNYAYGDLDHDALVLRLSVLKTFLGDDKGIVPFPFGGTLCDSEKWGYMYMGALNHFIIRRDVGEKTREFVKALSENGGSRWQIFDAVAWFCGMQD